MRGEPIESDSWQRSLLSLLVGAVAYALAYALALWACVA